MTSENRPVLTPKTPVQDFLEFYWLKEELIDFCQRHGLRTSGGKIEITQRIAQYLRTGKVPTEHPAASPSGAAGGGPLRLALDAPLTKNYNNGERVRTFFESAIGPHFHFTVGFMKFCRENPTKTFADAIRYWEEEHQRKKDKSYQPEISAQFEYNQYIRDFMADNRRKGATLSQAIQCWKGKRSQRGDNKYDPEDLAFLKPDSGSHADNAN